MLTLGIFFGGLLLGGAVLATYYFTTQGRVEIAADPRKGGDSPEPKFVEEPPADRSAKKPPKEYRPEDILTPEEKKVQASAKPTVVKAPTTDKTATSVKEKSKSDKTQQTAKPKPREPFQEVEERKNRLELPPHTNRVAGLSAGTLNKKASPVVNLYVDELNQCQLALIGQELASLEGEGTKTELKPEHTSTARVWRMYKKLEKTLASPTPFAEFRLLHPETGAAKSGPKGDSLGAEKVARLMFQWLEKPPVRLSHCQLEITVGKEKRLCSLNHVDVVNSVQINVNNVQSETPPTSPQIAVSNAQSKLQTIEINPLEDQPRSGEVLRTEVQFRGVGSVAYPNGPIIGHDKTISPAIEISPPGLPADFDKGTVELDIRLEYSTDKKPEKKLEPPRLHLQLFGYVSEKGGAGDFQLKRYGLTAKLVETIRTITVAGFDDFVKRGVLRGKGEKTRDEPLKAWDKTETDQRHAAIKLAQLRGRIRSLRASLNRHKDALEKATKDAEKAAARTNVDATGAELDSVNGESEAVKAQHPDAARNVDKFHLDDSENLGLVHQYEKVRAARDRNVKWCEVMSTFLPALHDPGRFEYRVYLQTNEREMDLEITRGFRMPPAAEPPFGKPVSARQ